MRVEAQDLIAEENPFRKQTGDCQKCSKRDVRVFWCHVCGKKFCWECFLEHGD